MTNEYIYNTAILQSSIELGCTPADFFKERAVVVNSVECEKARVYLNLPFECNIVSYGRNVVASVGKEKAKEVKEYLDRFGPYHVFETPNLHYLDEKLSGVGLKTCFMAEYFLPDVDLLSEKPCDFKTVFLEKGSFEHLYKTEWSNALCEKRKQHDMLCCACYDGDVLCGLAGASADCESMWQIGIDVLPEYRNKGIASSLTSRLALEIIKRGKVPFYCAAWSNIGSVRNALSSGFKPAWVELTAKKLAYIDEMNSIN